MKLELLDEINGCYICEDKTWKHAIFAYIEIQLYMKCKFSVKNTKLT